LLIRTENLPPDGSLQPTGQNLVVRLVGTRTDTIHEVEPKLDGVRSVTVQCDGRNKPITAVLVIDGVLLDMEADLTPAASAAIRLARAAEEA
jgi:hypothetical protein